MKRLLVGLGAMSVLLAACSDAPPTCAQRLTGIWRSADTGLWDMGDGKPRRNLSFVTVVDLKEDGALDFLRFRYEDPDRPGEQAPNTPIAVSSSHGWSAVPAADPAKADCQWVWTEEVKAVTPSSPASQDWSDIKFAGPDQFTDLATNLVYTRVPPDKAPKD